MADFLVDLIGNIYEAAADQTLWPWVLAKLTDIFGGGAATVSFYDLAGQRVLEYASAGLSDQDIKDYLNGIMAQDPRLAWALAHPAIATYFDRLHTSESEMDRNEFYAWLGQRGLRYSIARQEFQDGVRGCLALERSAAQGPVSDDDVALFDRVAPHVVRAAFMARRIGGIDLSRACGEDTSEHVNVGIVVVDAGGHPLHVNRTAREIAAIDDGLSIGHDRISAARREEDDALQRALTAIAAPQRETAAEDPGHVLSLSRPSGKRPLAVRVAHVNGRHATFADPRPAAVVFVRDPEAVPSPPRALLKGAYKLTPRECDVALALTGGKTLEEAAKHYGLARATVRVHLRSLLHKTGTHSQSALVRLLTAMVPGRE